jgi:hypothetical protein
MSEQRDPRLAYQRALTAYGAMVDELRDAFTHVFADLDLPDEARQRLDTALMGAFAARALLDTAQYKRIEALVVNEQREIGRQIDRLAGHVESIDQAGQLRDQKLDRIIDMLIPTREVMP